MEITDFLSQSFLTTFTGTLVAIELVVFVTKGLPIIKKIPTRVYTFTLALTHSLIMNIINGTFTTDLKFFYLLFINTLVVTITLCGGYDVVVGNVNLALNSAEASTITKKGSTATTTNSPNQLIDERESVEPEKE